MRLIDGSGEKVYPRSSFSINCTGDVCIGDIVLFKQKVYERYDLVTRGANVIGQRIIAGRVVKESYGAAKQQHTFTVEIFWSKGVKSLPPLFPLLIKGRNLYRLKTFRQRWDNEAERVNILAEKHKRGAVARHIRALRKDIGARGSKAQKQPHFKKSLSREMRQESMYTSKTQKQLKVRRASSQRSARGKRNGNMRDSYAPSSSKRRRHPDCSTAMPYDRPSSRQCTRIVAHDNYNTRHKLGSTFSWQKFI